MRRVGHLYGLVAAEDNLRLADLRARRRKRGRAEIAAHDRRKGDIPALHDMLVRRTFRTSRYTIWRKRGVNGGKDRVIFRLPYYPDRIVHHAIMNVLEPIWLRLMPFNTFSCIKERGIEGKRGCARHVRRIIAAHAGRTLYCLKIDLTKLYPSIRHDVLKRVIRRGLKDPSLLWLLDEIIDSTDRREYIEAGYVYGYGLGVPIGNYVSQFFANLMLTGMMHRLNTEERVECAQYADDICIFSEDKARLHTLFREFVTVCVAERGLRVKDNWQVFPIAARKEKVMRGRALDYVGYKFYMRHSSLRERIKRNFCRRAARLNRKEGITYEAYRQGISPWLGWLDHCDGRNLMKKTLKPEFYEKLLRQRAAKARRRGKGQVALPHGHHRGGDGGRGRDADAVRL